LVPVRSGAVAGGICPGELRGIGISGERTGGTWRRGRAGDGRLLSVGCCREMEGVGGERAARNLSRQWVGELRLKVKGGRVESQLCRWRVVRGRAASVRGGPRGI